MARRRGLRVAVTGPTGTFGFGLVPLLEAASEVEDVVGVARSPFDPADHGWTKMTYRRGDVRDQTVLANAFDGADVVVHLAFMLVGDANESTIREINIGGTLNAFRAAVEAGAQRFVYASSVAAYGFHSDNPVGITEDWPTRPAEHLFYAQEKAELEALLAEESAKYPEVDVYLLRPPFVIGPHAVGGKGALVSVLSSVFGAVVGAAQRSPLPVPIAVPDFPMQLIHEDDVGQAFMQCILGAGPPGSYNIAGDGVLTGADVARELGFVPLALPAAPLRGLARRVAALPLPSFVPPVAGWAEVISHPAIMDTTKAKTELGWQPQYSALEALQSMLDSSPDD